MVLKIGSILRCLLSLYKGTIGVNHEKDLLKGPEGNLPVNTTNPQLCSMQILLKLQQNKKYGITFAPNVSDYVMFFNKIRHKKRAF